MRPDSGTVVDSYPWEVPYALGLYWDGAYFSNNSGKEDQGGDACIYVVDLLTSIDEEITTPLAVELLSAYPNPFNATTNISYSLIEPSRVRIDIFNLLGQKVETILDSYQQAGAHTLNWRADGLPSGIYYARISGGNTVRSIKITLLK
jgi:hypothetical protein